MTLVLYLEAAALAADPCQRSVGLEAWAAYVHVQVHVHVHVCVCVCVGVCVSVCVCVCASDPGPNDDGYMASLHGQI